MLHKLLAKSRGENVALKIDLAKDYDRIAWLLLFILKVLRKFGFSEVFVDIIWRLIST